MTDGTVSHTGFVTGERLFEAVRATVAGGRADIAVAFWGPRAVELLGVPEDASHVRVACDAFSGFCSPLALGGLLDRGAKVYDVPGLHAKTYLGGGTLVVGSANASSNGFGEGVAKGDLDLEAAFVSRQPDALAEAKRWLDRVFIEGNAFTRRDISEVESVTKEAAQRTGRTLKSFRDLLLNDPVWFHGRRLRVCMYDSEEPDADTHEEYREAHFAMPDEEAEAAGWPYYWATEEWDVDDGDLILDFMREGKKIICNGVWRVRGRTTSGRVTGVVLLEHDLCGAKFPRSEWKALARDVANADAFPSNPDSKLFDIVDFGRELRKRLRSRAKVSADQAIEKARYHQLG